MKGRTKGKTMSEFNQNTPQPQPQVEPPDAEDTFPLDEDTLALMSDYDQQQMILNSRREGTLLLFLKQHDLKGNWQMAQNGKELVKKK